MVIIKILIISTVIVALIVTVAANWLTRKLYHHIKDKDGLIDILESIIDVQKRLYDSSEGK